MVNKINPTHFVRTILIVVAASSCFGCVMATTKPLYDAKRDVVFDPRLVGRWVNGNGSMRFSRGEGNSYRIEGISEPARVTDGPRLAAHMVRIGKYYYLFFADPSKPEAGTRLSPCYRITLADEELQLAELNVGMIANDLKAHPLALRARPIVEADAGEGPHPIPEPNVGNLIVTDEPQAIREYFMQHQDDDGWVHEAVILHKAHDFSRGNEVDKNVCPTIGTIISSDNF